MKNWIIKNSGESPSMEGIHPNIAKLLASRGIRGREEIEEFLSSEPKKTYDPFLLKGMREAVEKIKRHIQRGSRICIYGDYDVDGVTAICLVFEFLKNLTDNLEWYIPVRQQEGYGINMEALKKIRDRGADLMISVDCGISSVEEVRYAEEIGLDTIITDHHTPGETVPGGIVINPKQPGCPYPYKELCGCGVAYKLIQALQRSLGLPKKTIKKGLDLVGVATIADIVPLLDENRTLVKYGLKAVNARKRVGLASLIHCIGGNFAERNLSSTDVAFILGPHINAGGRVDTAESSLKLLMTEDKHEAEALAYKLIDNNNLRKSLQTRGLELAERYLKNRDNRLLVLVEGEDIHEGVAGIVAGKLKEEYYRPTLIVTESEKPGVLKGTGRSIDSVNLYELLKTQEDLLLTFGGHKAACGFSLEAANLPAFRAGLETVLEEMIQKDPQLLEERLELDDELDLAEANNDFGWMLEKLEPFGQQNQRPLFGVFGVYIDNLAFVGKEREHSRFMLRDDRGNTIDCIMFNSEERFRGMEVSGRRFDFAGRINMNYRAGSYNIQLVPVDFKRS